MSMNLQEARRRAALMGAHVNWLRQRSGQVAPKAAVVVPPAPVKKVEVPVAAPAPVVEAPKPVEPEVPVAPAEEVAQEPVNLKEISQDDLFAKWDAEGGEDVAKEIFRRARKFAKKNKLQMPEGLCEGENVKNFIDLLKTPVEG